MAPFTQDHTPTKDEAQRMCAVELPKITHSWQIAQLLQQVYQQRSRPNKSTSTISVKKYLRVNSNQETLVEEEEEEEEEGDGGVHEGREEILDGNIAAVNTQSHTNGDDLSCDAELRGGRGTSHVGEEGGTGNRHSSLVPLTHDHLTLSKEKKEKLIANTAHALGVVSRDWAKTKNSSNNTNNNSKNTHRAKVVSGRHNRTSGEAHGQREQVKENSRACSGTGYRNHITTPAPASREQFKSSHSSKNNTSNSNSNTSNSSNMSRPRTVHSNSNSSNTSRARTVHREKPSGDDLKIEKLKSIYNAAAGRHSKNKSSSSRTAYPSRQPSRCSSRQASYLVTTSRGGGGGDREMRGAGGRQYSQSRPATRLGQGRAQGSQSRPITRMSSRQYQERLCRERSNNLGSLDEESSCWNELPLHTQGKGTWGGTFGVVDGTGRVNGMDNSDSSSDHKMAPGGRAERGVASDRVTGTAYNVYVADTSKLRNSSHSNTPVDPSSLCNALKGMHSAGWNEDLSLIVLNKKQEGGGGGGGEGGGGGGGTDKVAQAIALAMNFCKPRESLMKKLTCTDAGRKGRGRRRENKYTNTEDNITQSHQETMATTQLAATTTESHLN